MSNRRPRCGQSWSRSSGRLRSAQADIADPLAERTLAIPKRALACLLAGVLAGVAACGSSGPSKGSFIKQVDALCAQGQRDADALPHPDLGGAKQVQVAALASYLQSLVSILERTLTGVRALQSPSQDHAMLQRYLAALDQQISQARRLVAALRSGDAQGVTAARTALSQSDTSSLASQYGFHDCSKASATG